MTPIRIKVDPSHDASKVKAEGPGLSRSGMNTGQNTGQPFQNIIIQLMIPIQHGSKYSERFQISQREVRNN